MAQVQPGSLRERFDAWVWDNVVGGLVAGLVVGWAVDRWLWVRAGTWPWWVVVGWVGLEVAVCSPRHRRWLWRLQWRWLVAGVAWVGRRPFGEVMGRLAAMDTARGLVEFAGRRSGRERALALWLRWCEAIEPDAERLPRPTRVVELRAEGVMVTCVLAFGLGVAPLKAWRGRELDVAAVAGVAPEAVTFHPAGLAHQLLVRVRTGQPFGGDAPRARFDGQRSVLDPVVIGRDTGGVDVTVPLVQHSIAAGETGSGKSNALRLLMHATVRCRDAVLVVLDPQGNMAAFRRAAWRYARTVEEIVAVWGDLEAEAERRYRLIEQAEVEQLEPSASLPAIIVAFDEAGIAMRMDRSKAIAETLVTAAEGWRKVRIVVHIATQYPTRAELPVAALVNLPTRIALRAANDTAGSLLLDQWVYAGFSPARMGLRSGVGFVWRPGLAEPVLCQLAHAPVTPDGAGGVPVVPGMVGPGVSPGPVSRHDTGGTCGPWAPPTGSPVTVPPSEGRRDTPVLPARERVVVELLGVGPVGSQAEIARRTGMSTSTVSRAVRALQARGLVVVVDDGRIMLSAPGRETALPPGDG